MDGTGNLKHRAGVGTYILVSVFIASLQRSVSPARNGINDSHFKYLVTLSDSIGAKAHAICDNHALFTADRDGVVKFRSYLKGFTRRLAFSR